MSSLQSMNTDELIEEFDALGNWEDQCDYLIDLGLDLPDLPAEARVESNRVHGCQSNVWLITNLHNDSDRAVIEILADSDAMIVRGLIAVLLTVYSGRTPREILETDIRALFSRLGLDRHLSPQRRNGLFGMVERIRALAAQTL